MMKIRAFNLFTILVISSAASLVHAGELRGVLKNNQGVKRYESGRPADSYDLFTNALGDVPYAPELQYNIGNSFLQMKEADKALKQYEIAIRMSPGNSKREREVKFRSYFNKGAVLASQEKKEEALTAYQQALEYNPESVETKTNMELLLSGGEGGGDGDKDEPKKEDEGEGESKKPQDQDRTNKPNKPQPQPYKGKDLSKQDVDRILDELKQQEEQIRAKQQREGAKDAPPDKDW